MTLAEEPTSAEQRHTAQRVRRTLEGVLGVPATEGNQLEALRNGDAIFPAMLDAIDGAEHTIDFLTFVYWKGKVGTEFACHLAERARAGVRIRVLLDSYGAHTIDRESLALMVDAGVRLHWFRPIHRLRLGQINHRTHRKVMIVDEEVAFTGGVGIADEWLGNAASPDEWRDTHFEIRGPAVDGLRAAFLDNWAETKGELFDESVDRFPEQPKPGDGVVQCVRGASTAGWSDITTLFQTLLQIAQRRVRIATAYFIPDDDLVGRLCGTRQRGVTVDILLPGPHSDKRFVQIGAEESYRPLLEAGVRIWNFQPSMLHAKVMIVDDLIANVGSANLNSRSTKLDEEINVVALDATLVDVLDRHFDDDLGRSVEIELGRWRERSVMQRVVEQAARPVRRWF